MNEQNTHLALQLLILAIQNSDEIAKLFARGTTAADLDALAKENAEARLALQEAIDAVETAPPPSTSMAAHP